MVGCVADAAGEETAGVAVVTGAVEFAFVSGVGTATEARNVDAA